MRRTSGLVAALLTALGAPSALADFERQALGVPGAVLWLGHGDLDGDGFTDLVVSYRRGNGPQARRFLAAFFRGPEGYPSKPQAAWAAPGGVAAFDLGDAKGDGKDELVYLSSTGVFVQAFEGRAPKKPERLLAARTLASGPEEEDLATWDFLREPPGFDAPIMILPTRRGLRIERRGEEGWDTWARVRLDLFSYYDAESPAYRPSGRGGASGRPYAFRVTTIVPNLEWVDQTGDGRPDLVTYYEDRVEVFPQSAEGALAAQPTYRRWFQVRTPEELESRDVRVSAKVRDLDGDGIADIAVSKIGGGITTLRTEVRLYRGEKGGGFSKAPVQVFSDEGFAALSDFVDVDGDGALEMIHPHAEVSIMAMSRAMFSKTLELEVRIRETDPGGRFFRPAPVQVLETSYGLDLSVGAAIRGAAPMFGHDFSGDGRPDVLLSDGGEAMVLHVGEGKGRAHFSDDGADRLAAEGSNTTLAIPARPGRPEVDVVVYYVARKSLAGRIYVFRRKGG